MGGCCCWRTLTQCLRFTSGCTTMIVQSVVQPVVQPVVSTMQMSPAKRRLSGPARTLMMSLG